MSFLSILGVLSPVHIKWFTFAKRGKQIGKDGAGNIYYEAPARPGYKRPRRWVIYNGREDPSRVPPEWHGWLHYQSDTPPPANGSPYRRKWQKPPSPNLTGTTGRYLPPGHVLNKGERPTFHGDYEAWTPSGAEIKNDNSAGSE